MHTLRNRAGGRRFATLATEGVGGSGLAQGGDTATQRSTGRKTVSVMRGFMMLCETCYDHVIADRLLHKKNYVADHEALFDTICPGCTDINRPLIDDMLGSSE